MITRRNFCAGLAGLVAAPYVIRNSSVLMPIADRRQGYYIISGHDQFGRRISERLYVSQATIMDLHRTDMRLPEYRRIIDGIFMKAFGRDTLVNYNPYSVGRLFDEEPTAVVRDLMARRQTG